MVRKLLIGVGILVLLALGALVWLARAPITPVVQKVEKVIPDERIPH